MELVQDMLRHQVPNTKFLPQRGWGWVGVAVVAAAAATAKVGFAGMGF